MLKALLKTRDLFESWKMGDEGRDLRSAEEQEWSTTELRNSLRSIEWDLEVRTYKRAINISALLLTCYMKFPYLCILF